MSRPSPLPPIAVVALVALLGAAPARAQAPSTGRPPDSLLARPDLQALVDLQVRRDGPALAARLDDPDPAVRARAAFALGSVQDPTAVPGLLDLLADPDAAVRADAAFALGQSADSTAAGRLGDALAAETGPTVRRLLLEALGKTGGSASLARLGAADPPPGLGRAWALAVGRYALRGLRDPAAVERLAGLLGADDPGVVEAAAWAFTRMPDPGTLGAAGDSLRAALDRAYAFQYGGPGVTAPEGPSPAAELVAAVGRLGDPADTGRLVHWLQDAVDWRARVNAARALGTRTGEEAARRGLFGAFSDASPHVAVAAARALGTADSLPPEAIHDMAAWSVTHQRDWRIVGETFPALAKEGADGFVIFYLMWLDANEPDNHAARAKALDALGDGSTKAGFLVLEDEAGWKSPQVRAAAVGALARRWDRNATGDVATVPRYYAAFVRAMEEDDPGTISAAAPALADSAFRPLGGVGLLEETYRRLSAPVDIEAMVAILEALGRARDPDARPLLREALRHPHPVIRRAAADALEASTGDPVAAYDVPRRPDRTVDWSALAELGPRPRLVLETDRGRITIEMDAEAAPLTVQTVAGLARDGAYDGVPFHRVVPNFVIQGGDVSRGDGWGGPGFVIDSEFTRIPYARGAVGMASAGKDTEGSQFFVTHSIEPRLDGRYTAFGRVTAGMDVVDAIVEQDRVVSARVEPDR